MIQRTPGSDGGFGGLEFFACAAQRVGARIRCAVGAEAAAVSDLPEKTCAGCGRRIVWRRRWAACWPSVRFCGERCRRRRPDETDAALERAIRELLECRAAGATICPSEAARRVAGDGFRELMERVRSAARRMVSAGELEILQRGRIVDPSTAKGPIRLRRVSRSASGG